MTNETAPQTKRLGDCVQVGLVVRDIDRTMAMLSELFGMGPFRTLDWPPADRADLKRFYRGKPGNYTSRMAWADLGPIELELIQPLEGESIFRDYLEEHGEGIHHLKFLVAELEPVIEYLAGFGIEVSLRGEGLRPGTEWAFFGTESQMGFGIEIMNVVPGSTGRTPLVAGGKVQD
jgi:methylmalonyl-CoA/ethylmalonyl-CoA epimerase